MSSGKRSMTNANVPTPKFPETSVGVILQRGGEELYLKKISDRFSLHLVSLETKFPSQVPCRSHRLLPQEQLYEVEVEPKQLEEAMIIARRLDTVAFASHIYQSPENPETKVYLTQELTLQFAPEVEAAERDTIATKFHLQSAQEIDGIPNAFVYHLTDQSRENPLKIANRLTADPKILTAEANVIVEQESYYRPKDNFYPQQWYLHHNGGSQLSAGSHVDAEKAWDITRGVRSVVVAVTDDAIDINHPDFKGSGKIVAPRDFKDKDFTPLPGSAQESHGTACAGVAVAEETGSGIVGVAPGCALMPIRTSGFLSDRAIEEIFNWAMDKGASVISCSWGAATVHFPLSLRQKAALTKAATKGRKGKGCVIVFAAGNANRPINGTIYERNWPNNLLQGSTKWLSGFTVHPDIITVSACTSLGKKSAYSNWGNQISVCAPSNNGPPGMWFPETGFISTAPQVSGYLPGLGIFTTDRLGSLGYDPGNFTRSFGGTSSACPVVAGVAALVLSANPDLTAREVKEILQQTADKIVDRDRDPQLGLRMGTYDNNGYSQWFGYGKVNAFKAVQEAKKRGQVSQPTTRTLEGRNNNRMHIPDNLSGGIISNIQFRETGKVQDIQVRVEIDHDFLGDLELYLISPGSKTALLQNRTLGARTRLNTTYFLATTPALKQLLNQSISGVWQLRVVDYAKEDTGTLKSWQLTLKG